MRWQCQAEGSGPGQPGVMEHGKVATIVGDEDPAVPCRGQELGIVRRRGEPKVPGGRDPVAGIVEQGGQAQRDIVVEVEVGHQSGSGAVEEEPSVDVLLVPSVVGERRVNGLARELVVGSKLVEVAANRLELANQRPVRHTISLQSGVRSAAGVRSHSGSI